MFFNGQEINKELSKLELLDFIFNLDLISTNEYKVGCFIRNAYCKQKEYDMSIKYREHLNGGKPNFDKLSPLIEANKQYNLILNTIKDIYKEFTKKLRIDINFIEKYLCQSLTIEQINKNNKEELNKIILKLTKYLTIFLYKFKSKFTLELFDTINICKVLIENKGLYKTCEETGLNKETIKNIINLNDFKYSSYRKLIDYFKI